MNTNNALDRLNGLLPLADNQRRLEAPLRDLHKKVLQDFVARGHPPSCEEMEQLPGDYPLDDALQQLASGDLVVLGCHRHGVSYGVLLDATEEGMLGKCRCPMLFVPLEED